MKATSSRRKLVLVVAFITLSIPCWGQSAYWTGDGGRGMSLGIIVPESQGLNADTAYLPAMVQGVLVANFKKYSAISVLDRVALDKVIAETLDPTYKDNLDIVRIGHVAQVGNMMTGKIMKTSSGYSLQINITDTTPSAKTIAAYSGACTTAQLDDQTAIQKASQELLTQMGVKLTDSAISELGRTNSQQVTAQTALAQGITAQKQGTEVAALSYYFQAAAFDPSLAEAVNRSSILAANISSGNIGADARNDIAWRKQWVERLTETEQYFDALFKKSSLPYTLFYSTEIIPGDINYQNETQTLSINTNLHAYGTWMLPAERVLQTLYDGLAATGRKETWGLKDWPKTGVTNLKTFERKNKDFAIVAELVNNNNVVIGKANFQSKGTWKLNGNEDWNYSYSGISISDDDRKEVSFTNVKADNITDKLTIRIASVNGTPAETAARNGVLQVKALSPEEWKYNTTFYSISKGALCEVNYWIENKNITIPYILWDEPVTGIGEHAFNNYGLTAITIGNNITFIGDGAFAWNQLTSVVIPNSVTKIGFAAFDVNQLTSITIGANVAMGKAPFENRFSDFYNNNGKKAGVYTWDGKQWNYKAR